MDLEWRRVPEGYETGSYRISRLPVHPRLNWRLSEVTDPESGWEGATFVTISSHGTLRAAMSSARHHEIERIHRARIRRHLVTAIAAAVAMTAAFAAGGAIGGALVWVIAVVVGFAVALRSVAVAVDLELGDGWGRLYREPEEINSADRAVAWFTDRLRFSVAANDVESPQPIRVITPEEQRMMESQR